MRREAQDLTTREAMTAQLQRDPVWTMPATVVFKLMRLSNVSRGTTQRKRTPICLHGQPVFLLAATDDPVLRLLFLTNLFVGSYFTTA